MKDLIADLRSRRKALKIELTKVERALAIMEADATTTTTPRAPRKRRTGLPAEAVATE
jgi:hypothetical protein